MTEFQPGDRVRVNEQGRTYYHDDIRSSLGIGTVVLVSESLPHPTAKIDVDGHEYFLYVNCLDLAVPDPPTFASIEEADAWLDAQRGGT